MTKREKVARAIYEADNHGPRMLPPPWNKAVVVQETYLRLADAAIAAMENDDES